MADKAAIAIEAARIPTASAGRKRNAVDLIEVVPPCVPKHLH
ncbi:hypothetical protein FHT92_000341 [Rhizobium sp. BK377]|nr:hypothetical protein [Rhizobium sp. BK377]